MELEKVVEILQICERWRRNLCSLGVVAGNACVLGWELSLLTSLPPLLIYLLVSVFMLLFII